MNQSSYNYEDHRQNGGAVAWLFIAMGFACLIGMIIYLSGCRSPLIEVNRNSPLISNSSINPIKIDSKLIVKDSANGNTVPQDNCGKD